LLILLYKKLVLHPPNGSVLTKVIQITGMAIKQNGGRFWKKDFWDNVKPSTLQAKGITTFRGKDM
jgi:POT family proton-dependent oligopeptide transporter